MLFNGGVFKAELLRSGCWRCLGTWFAGSAAANCSQGEHDLDHAVARGAAYYGWAKQRGGVRIRGGTARAYYVGIETAGWPCPARRGRCGPCAWCPSAWRKGPRPTCLRRRSAWWWASRPSSASSARAVRKQDRPGDVLDRWAEDELGETDSLEATLPADEAIDEPYVPVRFQSRITELGVLELWCVGTQADRRWKLEFSVREDDAMSRDARFRRALIDRTARAVCGGHRFGHDQFGSGVCGHGGTDLAGT